MAPRMDVIGKDEKEGVAVKAPAPSSNSISRPSSQAEAVAAQVEASLRGIRDDTTEATTPPETPPRIPKPESPVRHESALKRLGQRLRIRGRRSLSAPPALRRRRRRPLLEEHFRVEKDEDTFKVVLLPGVPEQEDNWERDLHDYFNLVVLVPVVVLNVMNWSWDQLLQNPTKLGEAWTGEYYESFFYTVLGYFVADLLWVSVIPACVRSPSVIIQHHLATIFYIMVPHTLPHVRWCMGACMSVEINTWLLIARRVFNKQGFPPWTINFSFFSIRIKLISTLFYVTWIGIRCILYPYMLIHIFNQYLEYTKEIGTYWNLLIVCFPLHFVFCMLNLKWSYDLLMSKIRYWKRRGIYNAEDAEKDKGL
jgi:TLC domain